MTINMAYGLHIFYVGRGIMALQTDDMNVIMDALYLLRNHSQKMAQAERTSPTMSTAQGQAAVIRAHEEMAARAQEIINKIMVGA